jgi:phosphatidylinositol-3-phosphatase
MNRSRAGLAGFAAAAATLLAALGIAVPAGAAPAAHMGPVPRAAAPARMAAPARTAARHAPGHATRAAPAPFVIIMMENHGLHPVLNDRTDMPYLNGLWRGGASLDFTRYAALAHPSLPNYLGMASGFTQATSDSAHPGQYAGPSVWDQLTQAGVTWGIFEEGMPSACSNRISYNDPVTNGQYLLRHDPGVLFGTVYGSAECQRVQPLGALDYASLPAVSFITPNTCDDMHGLTAAQLTGTGFANCLKGSGALEQRSDQWLSQTVPNLTAAGATVLITFDECCSATLGPLYAIEAGPAVTPGSDGASYSHYSVLAGIEDAYGLSLLGGAATANPIPVP